MGDSTPSPDPSVNDDIDIDYADYLKVADANHEEHKRAVHLIYIELSDELLRNGVFHFKSVAEIADDYGWCRGEVLRAALYMWTRGLIDLRIDDPTGKEKCLCDSCFSARSFASFKFDTELDRHEAWCNKQRELDAARAVETTERTTPTPKEKIVSGDEWSPRGRRSRARGYVYLLRAGDRYKIGVTNNLQRRLDQLNSGQAPFPIEVIHHVEGDDYVAFEGTLHAKFNDDRVHGEWFSFLPDGVAAVIEAMNEWAAERVGS